MKSERKEEEVGDESDESVPVGAPLMILAATPLTDISR